MNSLKSKEIGAVIFDMDGLMFDTETASRKVWTDAAARFGHELSEEIYQRIIGRDFRWREKILKEAFGESFPFSKFKDICVVNEDSTEINEGLHLKAGVRECLSLFQGLDKPIALSTGTARHRVIRRLKQVGLQDYFRIIVTSDDVSVGKPAPDIYLETSLRLNIAPERCLVLEDSIPGVHAAASAGMHVIMIPDIIQPGEEEKALCLTVLESLCEVPDLMPKRSS